MPPVLSAQELPAAVQQTRAGRVVKVLFQGNSGKGKSFLLNALLGEPVFRHAFQPGYVTDKCEFALYVVGDTAYVLCNVPGLIEADPVNIARNTQCTQEAFEILPEACTIVVFVMGGEVGGRLTAEDVEAYRAVCNYVPALAPMMSAIVVNGVNSDNFANEREYMEYYMNITTSVHRLINPGLTVRFTKFVPKRLHNNFADPQMEELRATMEAIIGALEPAVVVPQPGARLLLDRQALEETIRQTNQQLIDLQNDHKANLDRLSAEWQQRFQEQQAAFGRQLAEIQRSSQKRGGGFFARIGQALDKLIS